MKFRVLGGKHVGLDKKIYKKGDIVKSPVDLRKKFNNKFELVVPDPFEESAPSKKSKKKKDKGKPKAKVTLKAADPRGKDITSEHEEALADSGLVVFTKGGGWVHVYEPEAKDPLNPNPLKAKDLKSFVEDYLEE